MKTIKISVLNMFALLLVFLGTAVFINGIVMTGRIAHIGTLDSMQLDDLEEGYYVRGEVSRVLGNFDAKGNFYAAVGHNLNTMEDEYIIPMGKQYITISVPQKYKNTFETFTNVSGGHSLPIRGKIVKYKNGLHYKMLKSYFNLKSEAEVNAVVSELYCIKIIEERAEAQVIVKGLSIIISGLLLFFGFDNPIRQYRKSQKAFRPDDTVLVGRKTGESRRVLAEGKGSDACLLFKQTDKVICVFDSDHSAYFVNPLIRIEQGLFSGINSSLV